jgi:Uma2 family endonuclease
MYNSLGICFTRCKSVGGKGMLATEVHALAQLRAQRKAWGVDQFDEVWEGVYLMSPAPNIEHQQIVARLVAIIQAVLDAGGGGTALPGINVSDREDDWSQNYRCPDVAVILQGGLAKNCDTHLCGGPDLVVEIVSPDDRSREKLGFYSQIGVHELLIVDRDPWTLELYRLEAGQLKLAGRSTPDSLTQLQSTVLPLNFRLVAGDARPVIEVEHHDGRQKWRI